MVAWHSASTRFVRVMRVYFVVKAVESYRESKYYKHWFSSSDILLNKKGFAKVTDINIHSKAFSFIDKSVLGSLLSRSYCKKLGKWQSHLYHFVGVNSNSSWTSTHYTIERTYWVFWTFRPFERAGRGLTSQKTFKAFKPLCLYNC